MLATFTGNLPALTSNAPDPATNALANSSGNVSALINTSADTGANAQTGTGAGPGASTGTVVTANPNTNTTGVSSTYTSDRLPFTGNLSTLVAGPDTFSPGGSSLTSFGHTIAVLTSATGGQIQVDGNATILPTSITTNAPMTSSRYTMDDIVFTGNPTNLTSGTVAMTSGNPSLTSSGHTIASLTNATGNQVQVDTNATSLPSPNIVNDVAIGTSGTNTGTNTGTSIGTNAVVINGTGISRTSYVATNIPSGLPWGVMRTTVSSNSYTLTWVGSKIVYPTTIMNIGPSTTQTTSQTAGGFIWTVPTLPPGYPEPPPGPPPGFPDPISGGIDPVVPGCIFGCEPPGLGGGGSVGLRFPCLIDCGGGGGGNPDPDPNKANPSDNDPSNSKQTQSQLSSTASASSCSTSTFPSCRQVMSV